MRWKPDRAETVYRLRLRQRRFPSGKSPTGRHNRKKNRQNSDISQYGNGNAGIIARTEISPFSCSTPIFIP
ncbi:hypothetical protein E0X97_20830 [Salmonella enterica subsp. enterica serovar Alachua]|nr:hypothetical protein [Salmonella enterica subsp. enterica serovar Alachua]